jgi:hypothetical protein
MVKKVFTVFDEKSEAYLQPFFLDTLGQATRAITDCVNDNNHQFGRHPSDYTLFQLGEFDDILGEFKMDKKSLGCLIEYKTQLDLCDDSAQLDLIGGDK